MSSTRVLVVEGLATLDGRRIEIGATTWREGSIPVYDNRDPDKWSGDPAGYVTEIVRQGPVVLGTLTGTDVPWLGVTFAGESTYHRDDDTGLFIITAAEIVECFALRPHNWPWQTNP